jgi:deoxyribose-phosphate aldolase
MSLPHASPDDAIAAACRAVRESGCDAIAAASGYHPFGGATLESIKLLRKYGDGLLVIASGGISSVEAAQSLIDAGADRAIVNVS